MPTIFPGCTSRHVDWFHQWETDVKVFLVNPWVTANSDLESCNLWCEWDGVTELTSIHACISPFHNLFQMENYIYEDFLNVMMGNLKDFLDLRGLSTTGRKVELATRAFSAFELKMPIRVSQEHQLSGLREEYATRLQKYGLSDPNSPNTNWVDDMTKWPPVDFGNIFSYILEERVQLWIYREIQRPESIFLLEK